MKMDLLRNPSSCFKPGRGVCIPLQLFLPPLSLALSPSFHSLVSAPPSVKMLTVPSCTPLPPVLILSSRVFFFVEFFVFHFSFSG